MRNNDEFQLGNETGSFEQEYECQEGAQGQEPPQEAARTASAKALRQERAWQIQEMEEPPW